MLKIFKHALLATLLLSLAGCAATADEAKTEGTNAGEAGEVAKHEGERPASPDPGLPVSNDGKRPDTDEAPVPPVNEQTDANTPLTEPSVAKRVGEAYQRFAHVMMGGTGNGEMETFTHDGIEYRYLGNDIGTKEKLAAYLEQSYSPKAVEEMLRKYRFIERHGRMAQPNADGGTLLQWSHAQPQFVDGNEREKIFELKVPYGEGKQVEFRVTQVKFVFVEGKGWRIDHELK
ncbi:hypothetical protein BSNK01_01100 [Bacillaceae bacterium]